jgi:hypothetical protein
MQSEFGIRHSKKQKEAKSTCLRATSAVTTKINNTSLRNYPELVHQLHQEAVACGFTEPGESGKHFKLWCWGSIDKGQQRYVGNAGNIAKGHSQKAYGVFYRYLPVVENNSSSKYLLSCISSSHRLASTAALRDAGLY